MGKEKKDIAEAWLERRRKRIQDLVKFEPDKSSRKSIERINRRWKLRALSKRRQMEPDKQIESLHCLHCRTLGSLIPTELIQGKTWSVECRYCKFKIIVAFEKNEWKLVSNENRYNPFHVSKKKKKKLTKRIKNWVKNTW